MACSVSLVVGQRAARFAGRRLVLLADIDPKVVQLGTIALHADIDAKVVQLVALVVCTIALLADVAAKVALLRFAGHRNCLAA